jgi:hypothetical protein
LEPFFEGPVLGRELADTLLEGGVLGRDAGDGVFRPLGFEVADLAEETADAGSLGRNLGMGGFQGVLGVQRSLPPGRVPLVIGLGEQLDTDAGHGSIGPLKGINLAGVWG